MRERTTSDNVSSQFFWHFPEFMCENSMREIVLSKKSYAVWLITNAGWILSILPVSLLKYNKGANVSLSGPHLRCDSERDRDVCMLLKFWDLSLISFPDHASCFMSFLNYLICSARQSIMWIIIFRRKKHKAKQKADLILMRRTENSSLCKFYLHRSSILSLKLCHWCI